MNCQHHNEQTYVYICTTNHSCQRKFCAICFEEHQKVNPGITYTNIQNFFIQAKQTFNDLDITQINFKTNLQSLQTDFTKLLDKIRDSFLLLVGDLNSIAIEHQIMKDKLNNSTMELLTNQDLNKIVEVLNSNILQYLKLQKNKINRVLKKVEDLIAQKLRKMMEWFGNFAVQKSKSIINYKGKKIELIGSKILGIEHGEYEYKIYDTHDESDHVKAGKMFFNQKMGSWKVLKGLKNKQKDLKWHNVRYEYGKEIIENVYEDNNILLPGELNQQKLKEGKFYFINQNEIVVEIHYRHEKTGSWKFNEMKLFDQRYLLKDSWGGQIDKDGHNTGKWIENEEMHNGYDIVYFQSRGYYLNGKKEGKWIWVKELQSGQEQNKDNQNVEGNKGLQQNLICWEGEYCHGKKQGQWSMYFNGRFIGYGSYDDQQKKSGYWKETDIEFLNNQNQIVYFEGNYKDDLRVGQWFIYFEGEKIGGGFYDQGVKVGTWQDLEIKYNKKWNFITFKGMYANGKRVGKWLIYFKNNIVGEGYYNEMGQKIGKWIEINNNFFNEKFQIRFEGEYKNGNKVGLWQLYYGNQLIGGGNYNNEGKRQGIWKEFRIHKNGEVDRIPIEAEYQNGVEIWSRGPQIIDAYQYGYIPEQQI